MLIYINISNDLVMDIWKPSHFFQSIGYPILLSKIRAMVPNFSIFMTLFQAFASSLTLLIFYQTVKESLGKRIGLITLCIGSIHVPWILFSNYALPETFFTFFLSLCAWFSIKLFKADSPSLKDGMIWGFCFILAFWLKGTHAFLGPFFLIALFLVKRTHSFKAIVGICFVVGLGLVAHGTLTYKKIGKIQLTASTGGLNFIEGKCPHKINGDSTGIQWQSPLYYQLEMNATKYWEVPFTNSGYYFKEGLKCIQSDPFVLVQSLESIPYLFIGNTTWPFNRKPGANFVRLYELFLAVFFIFGLIIYGFAVIKRNISPSEIAIWVTPVIALFLCVYIFKSEMRYRIPFDLWLIPLAVKGWLSMR